MRRRKKASRTPLTSNAYVDIPSRATLFLRGLAANPAIRRQLVANGYRAEDHAEGLRLLSLILEVPAKDPSWDPKQHPRNWSAELAEVARTKLRTASILLRHRDPDAHAVLFHNIDLSGREPELATVTFFHHFQAAKMNRVATETLASIGITQALWERINPEHIEFRTGGSSKGDKHEDDATLALRDWLDTWTAVAREVLSSRESLIRLGLVGRRRGKPHADAPVE